MVLKVIMLVVFFAIMLGVGFYSRKHTKDVNGFVLGGRSVGPWLTAFAYGTSYFSAVIFIGYAGQFGWKYGIASTWIGIGNALLGSLVAWVVLGRRTRLLYAGVLREEILQQVIEAFLVDHHLHLPHSIYSVTVQRTFKTVRNGVQC